MIANGSDVHQGGDGPLMRAALADTRIPMMEFLVAHGANVNALWNGSYPIICAPCETLAARALKWLLDHAADPRVAAREYGSPLKMLTVFGGTLLHLAVEYDDIDVARWLIERGADANAKAGLDADGFGGHTPLFHVVVTLAVPDDSMAKLLLHRGANPNARATIRKQLRDMGDPEKERMREFHNVTPIGYANQFQEPSCVNGPAITAIVERGGAE
jgi:ankyrin repeat protein